MALTKLTTDLNIVSALADLPNATSGLTAAQLKAKFDEGNNAVKTYINNTLTVETDTSLALGVSNLTTHKTSNDHDGRYYTEAESDAKYETITDLTTNRKLSATGDFTGTLNGMAIVAAEPGLSSTVTALQADVVRRGVNVCSAPFNADPTGVSDSSAAIQAAIDSITVGIIYIPAGNFRLNTRVSCNKSNVLIKGAGTDQTRILFYGTGDALETNNGSWNQATSTYTPGFGTSIGSVIWEDFTISGANGTNVVGLQLARFTRGCRVNNVKFVSCLKGLVARESWYAGLNHCIFETNTLGAEFDREDNGFLVLDCVFSDNVQHINFPGLGTCRKFSIIGGSLDALGANGGAYFKTTQALSLRDIYMEVYSASAVDFIKLDGTCYDTIIDGCEMISPGANAYTGKWINLNGANTVKIDGNFQYQSGAVSLDTTGATAVEIGNNRFEGSLTIPASTLCKLRQTSVRFPATTTTNEWKEAVCRVSIGQTIPRVTISFDTDFTPGGQRIRIIRQDTSAVILDTSLGSALISAYTPVDLGSIPALSQGVLLLAYFYKVGSSISTPEGTLIIEQI